jgi:hypothetical protein
MKYIKTFESGDYLNKDVELKKYMIVEIPIRYELQEVLRKKPLKVNIIYQCYKDNFQLSTKKNTIIPSNVIFDANEESIRTHICYTSDSLEDSLNALQSIINTKKYNL